MDANRWQRLRSVFVAAVERPPADRPRFIGDAVGDDAELRREIEAMVAAHERSGHVAIDRLLDASDAEAPGPRFDLALGRLAEANPRGSEVVQHRYFAGLTLEQTAELLGVSTKTVQRDWLAARAWLRKELEGS